MGGAGRRHAPASMGVKDEFRVKENNKHATEGFPTRLRLSTDSFDADILQLHVGELASMNVFAGMLSREAGVRQSLTLVRVEIELH